MTMTESAQVRRINALCGECYFNNVSGKRYRLIRESEGICHLEGIDRRVTEVARSIIDASEVWEKL